MIQTLPETVTFEEFIEWYPNDGVRYELHNGIIIQIQAPTGDHEKVVGFLARNLTVNLLKKCNHITYVSST